MNKKIYKIFTVTAFLMLMTGLFIQGCSKVEDNLVTAPVQNIGTHPSGWGNPDSAAFHGNYLANNHLNISTCKQCHGSDFAGGIANVSCYRCHSISQVHNSAWYNSSDTVNFHGRFIMSNGWNMDFCKNCHGADFTGGLSQKTCYRCHEDGPMACYVCHGDPGSHYPWPPKSLFWHFSNTEQGVGAHDVHMNPDSNLRVSAQVQCTECHRQVSSFSDTNHIGINPGIAEVVFGPLAKTSRFGVTPNPQWNRTNQQCSNVYCHGYFKDGNLTATPTFTNPGSVVCGSCHGNPSTGNPLPGGDHPPGYTLNQCYLCHSTVINSSGVFVNKSLHINGVINYTGK
jgi:predicted CxxxxCH...CXXCH cytochrome family protein